MHTFLYRRMYFDELYTARVRGAAMLLVSTLCGLFDKYVIDGLVNASAGPVGMLACIAGLNDKYVVDGAVNGSGKLAWALGGIGRGAADRPNPRCM